MINYMKDPEAYIDAPGRARNLNVSFGSFHKGWASAYFEDPFYEGNTPKMLLGSARKEADGYTIHVAPNRIFLANEAGKLLKVSGLYTNPKDTQRRAAQQRHDEKVSVTLLAVSSAIATAILLAQSPRMQADLADALDYVKVAVSQITDQ